MNIPQRRPGARPGRPFVPGQQDSAEMLDRLVKSGRIAAGQAAQYRVWESAKPPIDGGRERFDAWMASRPNLPGLPPMGSPSGEAGKMSWAEMDRPVLTPRRGRGGPVRRPQKNVMEMLDELERANKITEAQAEQVRRWDKARPKDVAGSEQYEAWMKRRPDVPGLREYWGERPSA